MKAEISPLDAMKLVGFGVYIEAKRRNDIFVLLLLSAIYVFGMFIALFVGIENDRTLAFLLNLGISFAWYSAHILTLLLMARQLPDETESRTLYPMLAKPIRRADYLYGKWLSCTLAGWSIFVALLLLSQFPWLLHGTDFTLSSALFFQAFLLTGVSIAMMGALSLFISLFAPKPVNVAAMVILLLFSSNAVNMIRAQFREGSLSDPVRWLTGYIPDFTKMNLFDRYTDGIGAVSAYELFALVFYGLVFIGVALFASHQLFARRPL